MNSSVALKQANFDYIDTGVSGKAKTVYVLGIGGFSKTAIVDQAKQDLLKKHPLKSNEALANITVNWNQSFYFIVSTTECTVTADIVQFRSNNTSQESEGNNPSFSENRSNGNSQSSSNRLFQIGDTVEYRTAFQRSTGIIVKIEDEFYFMKYTKKNGHEKTLKTTSEWLKKVD